MLRSLSPKRRTTSPRLGRHLTPNRERLFGGPHNRLIVIPVGLSYPGETAVPFTGETISVSLP